MFARGAKNHDDEWSENTVSRFALLFLHNTQIRIVLKSALAIAISLIFVNSTASGSTDPYSRAGFPSHDQTWNGADYATAFKMIKSGEVPLPRLDEMSGERVLERMTNVGNLISIKNPDHTFDERMMSLLQFRLTTNLILTMYAAEAKQGSDVASEIAMLIAFSLRVSAASSDFLEEQIRLAPQNKTREIRGNAARLTNSYFTTFSGVVASLGETDFYSESDLTVLLTAAEETLPALSIWFEEEQKKILLSKLADQRSKFSGEIARLVEGMLKSLK